MRSHPFGIETGKKGTESLSVFHPLQGSQSNDSIFEDTFPYTRTRTTKNTYFTQKVMRLFTWRQRHIVLACIVLLLLGFIPGLQNIPNSGPVVEEITPIDIDLDRAKLQYLQKANRLNSPLVQYNNTIYGHGEYELESDVPQCRKMFVVWTTDESTWQEFNSVSLESIFRYDACAQVFVYANNLPFDFFQGYNEAGFFLKVIRYDLPSLAKGKAGEKWAKGSSYTYKRSPYYAVHESDFLRVFLLYNYGGTYIDLDHFMLPMSRVLNNHKNMLGAETCQEDNPDCFLVHYLPGLKTVGDAHHFPNNVRFCAGNGVLLNWERHHPLMQKALDHFDNHYDPQCWGCAGPRLMGQLIPEYLSRVTLVAEKLVFPVQYREASTYLSREDDAFCEHIMQNAVGFHMYGQATSQQDVKKGSVTACIIAKVRLRPDDNVPFDKVRTPAGAVLKRAYDPSVMHSAKTCKNLQLVPLERNVAVVLLAYKRVDLVGRILEMFVESRYIREVVIWNNNPDRLLDADKLAKVYEKLPRNKYTGEVPYVPCVRVYNSRRDGNVLFLGRFAACLASSSPLCYFQDDDWIVRDTEQLLHLANREPHRVHSITNGEVVRTANSWKFGNPKIHMNAQFSWVGTGACVSRKMVQNFFLQLLASRLSVTDRTMADFFFTAWTNAPQDVIEGEIVELTRANAFSGAEGTKDWGKGTQRNIDYIMYSLSKLYEILTRPAYAEVRHLFLPYTPDVAEWYRTSGGGGSGGAANARHAPPQQYPNAKRTKLLTMPVYTNTTLLESETSLMQDPTLYPGCTVSNDRYRAILRTDASEFGLGHRPMYNPTFTLDMHVTQNSVPNYKFERNLRNMVDGSLSTNFEPIFRRKCHNITMEFLRPYPCTYVSVTLDAGPESVEMYVGLASESDVQSIGKYMLGRWDGTQTIYGGRAGVDTKNKIVSKGLAKGKNTRTDKQNVRQNNHNSRRGSEDRLGEVSWVVLEVCARISGAYFQDVKIYDIDLVAEV